MRLTGWTIVGDPPTASKFIAVGAPHTSNWDYLLFLGVTSLFAVPAKAIGKHTLVKGPFGWLMTRAIIPVRRDSGQGLVEDMVEAFELADELAVVIAPEGTREFADGWHSGFYRIAEAAGVPIVATYVDRENKIAGLSPEIYLTGDVAADMNRIRDFMKPGRGKHPDQAAPTRLRNEGPATGG